MPSNTCNAILLSILTAVTFASNGLYQYEKSPVFDKYFDRTGKNNKFVDIYTNHPNTEEVIDSYLQSSTPRRNNRRKFEEPSYYQENGGRYGQQRPQNDELHSDFGVFDHEDLRGSYANQDVQTGTYNHETSYGHYSPPGDYNQNPPGHYNQNPPQDNYQTSNQKKPYTYSLYQQNHMGESQDILKEFLASQSQKYIFQNHSQDKNDVLPTAAFNRRPKFKTKKQGDHFDDDELTEYFTSFVQKLPNYPKYPNNYEEEEMTMQSINDILKKQLVKIQQKKNKKRIPIESPVTIDDDDQIAESSDIDYQLPVENIDEETIFGEEGQVIEQPGSEQSKFLQFPLQVLKNKTVKFASKFLNLFTIVQFPNSRCTGISASSLTYEGICYHRTQCFRINGTAIGNCANGYGVCCVSRQSCGGSSSRNCTYFESPGYPNYFPLNSTILPPVTSTTPRPAMTPDPRIKSYMEKYGRQQEDISLSLACSFRVFKSNPRIQQMRIDFLDLELRGPTNGTCINERLIISGQNINNQIPIICGFNSGQHVYVDVSNLVGALQLSILATAVERKRHRIRICQYEGTCANNMNCLQYYTGVTGTITSFNYEQAAAFSRSEPGYFNNLNYAICIRREAGYCSITYRNTQNGVEYPFQLVNFGLGGVPTVPLGQAGAEIFNCPDDYIVINGIRLCGYKLNDGSTQENFRMNAPVTDNTAGPIVIPVRSDGNATGRGFKLFYSQNRCFT